MSFRISSILLILFFAVLSYAQQPHIQQFGIKEGLPSMTVYDVFQDHNDYIWLGTDQGVCRFDGQNFNYYDSPGLNSQSATRIQEDQFGRIWFLNFRQQIGYIENDSLVVFHKLQEVLDIPTDQGENSLFSDFTIHNGKLWVSTTDKIHYYDFLKEKWVINVLPPYKLDPSFQGLFANKIMFNQASQLWVLPFLGLPTYYDLKSNRLKHFYLKQDDQYKINLIDLFQTSKREYFITQSRNLEKKSDDLSYYFSTFNTTKDSFIPVSFINKELSARPIGLMEDQREQLWVYSYEGLYLFNKKKEKVAHYFQAKATSKVIEDRESNIWVSTLNDGLFLIFNNSLRCQVFQKENPSIHKLETIEDSLLVLGHNSDQHQIFDPLSQQVTRTIYSGTTHDLDFLYYDSTIQKLYLEQHALFRFDCERNYEQQQLPYTSGIKAISSIDSVFFMMGHSKQAIICNKEISRLEQEVLDQFQLEPRYPQTQKYLIIPHEGGASSIHKINDRQFLIAFDDGLYFYEITKQLQPITNLENKPIIATQISQTIDGKIWVSTSKDGIYSIENLSATAHYTKKDGLFFDNIQDIQADGNSLWILSKQGLQCLNTQNDSIRTYDRSDGLENLGINDFLIFKDKVWLGTSEGLVFFDKEMPSINTYAPKIHLNKVSINLRDTSLQELYELFYKENNLNIEFHAISYKSQGTFSYRYQMKGLSDRWITLKASQNEIQFALLPPNTYTLTIYAVNEDGIQSKNPIIINFHISPPYWQTWWFRGLIALIVLSFLGWQLWLMRRRQLVKIRMNQLRSQALQSQMNPHFIFNALNAIQRLMMHSSTEHAMGYLTKFARLIRQIFEISSLKAISLEKEEEFLRLYLDLEKLRFKEKVDIQFEIDPTLEEDFYEVPPLLVQPVIENSFKHGLLHKEAKGHLLVKFEKEGDFLHILVEDDGIGRQAASQYAQSKKGDRKSGLSLTQDRLSMLPQHPKVPENYLVTNLQDHSGQALGTRTELWIKLDFNHD